MEIFLWVFISVLYYAASNRWSFFASSLCMGAFATYYPQIATLFLMVGILYLLIIIVNLYEKVHHLESTVDDYKTHLDDVCSRQTTFLQKSLHITTQLKHTYTPSPSPQDLLDIAEEVESKHTSL